MVQEASTLVETVADDRWLEWGAPLMPSFVQRAEEAREREVEQKRVEAEQLKTQQRRKRVEAERVRREEQEKERLAREAAASRLSPTSSRVAARKTSNSSFAEEEEVDELASSQPKSKGKGRTIKGKEKASTSHRAFQEPRFDLPPNAALVCFIGFLFTLRVTDYLFSGQPSLRPMSLVLSDPIPMLCRCWVAEVCQMRAR